MTLNAEAQGLKRRQTYEEVIEYLEKDPDKIIHPDRRAKFLRNGFELACLDKHNYDAMIEHQTQLSAHHITEQAIRQSAVNNGTSTLTESALRHANAAPIQYRYTQDPNDYIRGGILSSFGGAVGNVIGSAYSGATGALGSLFGGYGRVERPQGIPLDAGSAYHSLPSEYQTADDLQSFYSANLQRDVDIASQRSVAVRSQARQHLRDVSNQQEAILPLNTTDARASSSDSGGDKRGVILPLNTAAAGVGSLSSSSSGISSTLPAPPTEFYRMTPTSSIASKSNTPSSKQSFYGNKSNTLASSRRSQHVSFQNSPPVSIHSSPPVSIHSSPLVSIHSSPPASSHKSPPVSVHSSPSVSIHSRPLVSVPSTPNASVYGNSPASISMAGYSPISIHSSSPSISHSSMYGPIRSRHRAISISD